MKNGCLKYVFSSRRWERMAAYVNRTISMINAGNGTLSTNGDSKHYRESSPLQIFVKAKKKINDIFSEINDYVQDSSKYVACKCTVYRGYHVTRWTLILICNYAAIKGNEVLITPEEVEKILQHVAKVRGIRDVLARDHMKVAFFGRYVDIFKNWIGLLSF